jgi:hypothetical protein
MYTTRALARSDKFSCSDANCFGVLRSLIRNLSSTSGLDAHAKSDSIWSHTLTTASEDLHSGQTTAKALLEGEPVYLLLQVALFVSELDRRSGKFGGAILTAGMIIGANKERSVIISNVFVAM